MVHFAEAPHNKSHLRRLIVLIKWSYGITASRMTLYTFAQMRDGRAPALQSNAADDAC